MQLAMRRMLVVLALCPASAAAQETITIRGGAPCAECRIRLSRVVTLGDSPDGALLHAGSLVAMDSQGRFIVAGTFDRDVQLVLFASDGMQLTTFGRYGAGPGEFRDIRRLVITPGDTVIVFESVRASVLAPGLEGYVRTIIAPVEPRAARPGPGAGAIEPKVANSSTGDRTTGR